jgi:hypothetical protein
MAPEEIQPLPAVPEVNYLRLVRVRPQPQLTEDLLHGVVLIRMRAPGRQPTSRCRACSSAADAVARTSALDSSRAAGRAGRLRSRGSPHGLGGRGLHVVSDGGDDTGCEGHRREAGDGSLLHCVIWLKIDEYW